MLQFVTGGNTMRCHTLLLPESLPNLFRFLETFWNNMSLFVTNYVVQSSSIPSENLLFFITCRRCAGPCLQHWPTSSIWAVFTWLQPRSRATHPGLLIIATYRNPFHKYPLTNLFDGLHGIAGIADFWFFHGSFLDCWFPAQCHFVHRSSSTNCISINRSRNYLYGASRISSVLVLVCFGSTQYPGHPRPKASWRSSRPWRICSTWTSVEQRSLAISKLYRKCKSCSTSICTLLVWQVQQRIGPLKDLRMFGIVFARMYIYIYILHIHDSYYMPWIYKFIYSYTLLLFNIAMEIHHF